MEKYPKSNKKKEMSKSGQQQRERGMAWKKMR